MLRSIASRSTSVLRPPEPEIYIMQSTTGALPPLASTGVRRYQQGALAQLSQNPMPTLRPATKVG